MVSPLLAYATVPRSIAQVVVVPDDVAAIAVEVHAMSAELDLVITAGGVGPTPDDVTMAGKIGNLPLCGQTFSTVLWAS